MEKPRIPVDLIVAKLAEDLRKSRRQDYLNGLLADGKPVLADGWMQASTMPSAAYPGYGYLWWLMDNNAYRAIGIFGQGICVHPEQQVVVALHSARPVASKDEDWALQAALCEGLAAALE